MKKLSTVAPRKDARRKLNINPNLAERAQALAKRRGQTFGELVTELLYREIMNPTIVSPFEPLLAEEEAHAAERAAAASRFATARPSADASKGAKRG